MLADYYSKYVELISLTSLSTECVILAMKFIFSRHGIAYVVRCDSGTQFTSNQFQMFAREWGFKLEILSPKHSQGNGFIERNVQTVKNLMKKCKLSKTDVFLALLELRNTPAVDLPSPAQLLMSRRLRGLLPVKPSLLRPTVVSKSNVTNVLKQRQASQKCYFDQKTKFLPPLKVGDKVRFQLYAGSEWTAATVVELCNQPRAYRLRTSDGREYVRNRRFIFKVHGNDLYQNTELSFDCDNFKSKLQSPKLLSLEFVTQSPERPIQSPSQTALTPNRSVSVTPKTYRTRLGREIVRPTRLDL